ncbi:MAG: hypothetical protein LBI59_02420 [Candidatus Accumulibacter sp.]|jgi:predicted transcriptional regulator|nr:hypothetical protein [Accumulibacter sp.]
MSLIPGSGIRDQMAGFSEMIVLPPHHSRTLEMKRRVVGIRRPGDRSDLADLTGRQMSSPSRSLRTMKDHGLVKSGRDGNFVEPAVLSTRFKILTNRRFGL